MSSSSALLEGNIVLEGGSQKSFCAAPHTTISLKILGAKETDHPRQQTSRLVATNHNIDDVDWLQNLNEDITWIHGDPVQEISQQLKQREQTGKTTSELHIIAHGNNGEVKLGNIFLTKQYLEESSEQLQDWKLEAIYLWSCEAGRNTELTTTLQALTGANIYASKNEISRENPNLSSSTGAEASLDALIGKTKTKQWRGKLASTKVLDVNYQQLVFDHTNYNTSFNNPNGSLDAGDVVLFKNVITIGGQAVDALFTLTSLYSTMSLERLDDGGVNSDYISMDLRAGDSYVAGIKKANAEISFYEAGTYTGSGTGNRVTLENVVINTYDIDATQYQVFKGFQSYEVANNTGLTISTQSDGSVKFDDADSQQTTGTQDKGRARVYYDAIDTFEIEMGSDSWSWVYFYFDFQLGPAWSGSTTTTDTPAANFTWSTRNLTEAVANDGSFSQSATITFNNPGTTVFAGSDGDAITHTATNVPSGLTTSVTRASATTATLTVTGNASAHTSANDLDNIELEFANSAFVVGSVGASSITDARITNFGLTFSDPTKGVTIAQTGTTDGADLLTTEAGGTSTFTVVLDAAPSANVTVSITGNDATEGSLSGTTLSETNTLTFTSGNWNTAQTVTVTGENDDVDDGDITTTLTATANNAGGYAGTESDTTTVKNTDDDTNGVTIAQTGTTDGSGNLLTTEAGGTSTFTVVLDAEPTSNVTVATTGNDATENSLSTDSLTFNSTNWNTAQTVTVTGENDDVDDGDITTTLTATANNAGGYAGTESDTTTVKNTDDDTNGVTITKTGTTDGSGNLLTTEAGGTSTFTVVLDAEPTSNVTVATTGNDATENSLSTDTLSFSNTNWNSPQTVTVTGVNDDIVDGDITTTLTTTASNTGNYAGTETSTVTVKNIDNDNSGPSPTPSPTPAPSDLIGTEPPNLVTTADGNGLALSETRSSGTWVLLQTNYSNADLQNSLQIISSTRGQIGAIGAISAGNILGKNEIYLEQGETLSFAQQSSNNSLINTPNIQLIEQNGSWQLALEDSDSNTDNDFNDLGITISTHSECQNPGDYQIAQQQNQINDGLFDLRNINQDSLDLQITVNSSSDFNNRLAFVRLDDDANNLSLNGISASDEIAFKDDITGALINPASQRVELQGESSQTITWNLDKDEFGLYAAVLITENNEIITIGSSAVRNGSPLLKSIGQNTLDLKTIQIPVMSTLTTTTSPSK